MKTLYLHIGTPKTGTSAIQNFCVQNRDALEKQDLYYPDFGARLTGNNANRNGVFYLSTKNQAEGIEKLQEAFETHDTILLSNEGFWNSRQMTKDGWKELLDICTQMGVQLKIIVYLRRQDGLIQSYWAQQIKEFDLTLNFPDYLASGEYTKFHLNYYEHLQMIASVIGKENMIVKVYEKEQYQGASGTLLSDFFSIFNLDISIGYIGENDTVNRSLAGIYLETKRFLNVHPNLGKRKSDLMKRLRDMQAADEDFAKTSKRNQFSYEDAVAFMKNYEECNQKVAKEFLDRENGVLFYRESAPADYSKSELSNADIQKVIDICGKVIAEQDLELKETQKTLLKTQKLLLKEQRRSENLQAQVGLKKYLRKLKPKK